MLVFDEKNEKLPSLSVLPSDADGWLLPTLPLRLTKNPSLITLPFYHLFTVPVTSIFKSVDW